MLRAKCSPMFMLYTKNSDISKQNLSGLNNNHAFCVCNFIQICDICHAMLHYKVHLVIPCIILDCLNTTDPFI